MILIITNKEDVHPNPVIEKLGDFPFVRINTEDLLTDYKIFWKNSNGIINWKIKCLANNLEIDSKQIISVWERRPETVTNLPYRFTEEKLYTDY